MALVDLITRQAEAHGSKPLYTFYEDGVTASRVLSYAELESCTRALAVELLSRGGAAGGQPLLQRGDRVMLVFLPSLDFILAFLACLRAGLTPVPCYPPDPRNLRVNVTLFATVCASCGAKVALTHSAYSSLVSLASMKESAMRWLGLGSGSAQWPELAWWDVEEATGAGRLRSSSSSSSPLPLDVSSPSDLAFLQYTSGSTSEPKGVRITHANISHNLATIVASLRAGPDTVVASWLPQYHDMGLIGSYLGVLACGGSGHYMSPLTFLKAPLAWLQMVARVHATHVQAPNFAYSLLARRWQATTPAERARLAPSLSLSTLRHAFNAAEPVTEAALTDFLAAFVPLGLPPAALSPGYGLAENTVYVCDGGSVVVYVDREGLETANCATVLASCPIPSLHNGGGRAAAGEARAKLGEAGRIASYVSCGPVCSPLGWAPGKDSSSSSSNNSSNSNSSSSSNSPAKNPDTWVLVVDPATCVPCEAEGAVGEIWVCSPSKAQGYDGRPEASVAAFQAHTVGAAADSATAWLRTGDKGFLWRGELFVCGRIKDLIISRGRNLYPQDIEAAIEAGVGLEDPAGGASTGGLPVAAPAQQQQLLRPGATAVFTVPAAELGGSEGGGADNSGGGTGGGGTSTSNAEEDALILVAEVREGVSAAALSQAVQSMRTICARDFGVRPVGVLLLRARGTRKTTSGKVSRSQNAAAFVQRLRGGKVQDKNPWGVGSADVLLEWRSEAGASGGGTAGGGGSGPSSSTLVLPHIPTLELRALGAAAGQTQAQSQPQLQAHPPAGAYRSLAGPELVSQLKRDIAEMLNEGSWESVPTAVCLLELGMDSLSLAQLPPRLNFEYGFHVADSQVFSAACTIDWLASSAAALRLGHVELPAVTAAAGAGEAAAAAAGAPQPPLSRPRPAVHQATAFETNCPCFLLCWK